MRVFYDGDCPRCRRLAARYARLDTHRRLDWLDLNESRDELTEAGIEAEAAMARLHLVDGEGEVHAGADALAILWRALPGRRWLGQLMRIPLLRGVVAVVYGFVARSRVRAPGLR